jgi:hypothetical protein
MAGITVSPLETEPITATTASRPVSSSFRYRLEQLVILIKLYMQLYPLITSCIAAFGVCLMVLYFVLSFRKPIVRNSLHHDYSKIDLHYVTQASKLDHWCLWGGDEKCTCDDFTEPISRSGTKDWLRIHDDNVQMLDVSTKYDVLFYGDDVVEGWNGRHFGLPIHSLPQGEDSKIREYFSANFTLAGGGRFEGAALGISGDAVRLLEFASTAHARTPWCPFLYHAFSFHEYNPNVSSSSLPGTQPVMATTPRRIAKEPQRESVLARDRNERSDQRRMLGGGRLSGNTSRCG